MLSFLTGCINDATWLNSSPKADSVNAQKLKHGVRLTDLYPKPVQSTNKKNNDDLKFGLELYKLLRSSTQICQVLSELSSELSNV